MSQHTERHVSACGIPAQEDVGRTAFGVFEDVAEGIYALAELGWVDCVWGEGVRQEKNRNPVFDGRAALVIHGVE